MVETVGEGGAIGVLPRTGTGSWAARRPGSAGRRTGRGAPRPRRQPAPARRSAGSAPTGRAGERLSSSASNAVVAAATTARRAPGSLVTRSRPLELAHHGAGLLAHEQRAQVVPRGQRGVRPDHEGVDGAVGHRTQLQSRGAEGPELGPPQMRAWACP